MGRIVTLDSNMVNMIAAGEVIERPASVVKELIENSIDAGATKITVSIEDGGRKSIKVTDNGCGMVAEDLAAAFEPHATSKVKNTSDLRAISTLGFRGEALASIGSVAHLRAVSKPIPGQSEGTEAPLQGHSIEIDCGNKGQLQPCSADFGTTIEVRDLFYKLPARRKFLRTTNTEMGHITEQFTRMALANRDLDMTLLHNSRELYRLSAAQGLRPRRIGELFSSQISENLIETQSDEKGLKIFALLGRPDVSRTNNKLQYVFLNERFIRDKFISHAIKEAYRGHLEPNRFPVVFLFIRMPYEDYDVNVHPTKIEVRFYNANLVHSQILGVLREKLLSTNLDTHVKLSVPLHKGTPAADRTQKITEAMNEFFKKHRPVQSQNRFSFTPAAKSRAFSPPAPAETQTSQISRGPQVESPELEKKFIQIHDSFIVAQDEDGFIIVDQHALHERIIYEQLQTRITKSRLESQKLLIPESFELTDSQTHLLETNSELMDKLGIELTPFGPKTYAVQAFPSILANASVINFVQDLIGLLEENQSQLDEQQMLDEVLSMAACKAAIKAGRKLTDSEIEQLLADKETLERASRCPHGRPSVIKFSISQLEKQFKRT